MNTELVQQRATFKSQGVPKPKLGEWYWVMCEQWETPTSWVNGKVVDGKNRKDVEVLMCVHHLASNHVVFALHHPTERYTDHELVRHRDLAAKTRREEDWKAIIQRRIEAKQLELSGAIKLMAEKVSDVGLIPKELDAPAEETLLPSVIRRDPNESKQELLKLKDKTFPECQKYVAYLTQHIVSMQKDMMLPMFAEGERMEKAVETVKDRLFALEMYAGLCETAKVIRKGEPAPIDTPVTIRQMLRYMDEETLIDYDKGGMNFEKLADFDAWVAKDENLNRMAPEPRCVVAFKVRRFNKDYGPCSTLGQAFRIAEMHAKDAMTYLLLRNGTTVWRLQTDTDFAPRLLPLREQFEKPLVVEEGWNHKTSEREYRNVTPDDFDYDKVMGERKATMLKYNTIMFLLQGLLDRSQVFAPHPPIALGDEASLAENVRLVYDEEDGLPSANPPSWEEYKAAANAKVEKGSVVWCKWHHEDDYSYQRYAQREMLRDSRVRPALCDVDIVTRDKQHVVLGWDADRDPLTRWQLDRTRPVKGKPGWFYQKVVTIDRDSVHRQAKVPLKECFNVSAYVPGDYKKFLCDAHLKGAYLQWAPQLLTAEKYHMEKNKETKA